MSESRNRLKAKAPWSWKRPEVLIGLCILVAYLLVWPVGEYAIEDDWAFSLTLRNLHENGELRILDWIPMTLVTHLFTGLLFTKILGFHLTLLKITTVLFLAVEAWAVMALLRRLGVGEGVIAMAGLTLIFNPLHFFQSFLYATDIPALAWSSLALLFYARGLEESRGPGYRWFWLGSVFASLAWGVRQSAVFVVGALFLYLLLYQRERLKSLRFWAVSFLLPTLSIVAFQAWYQNVHGPTGSYLQYSSSIRQALGNLSLLGSAETLFLLAIYAGFFVLPLALGFARSGSKGWRSPGVMAGGLVGIFLTALFLWASFGRHIRFPYLRNKITQFGFLSPNEIVLGAREVLWGSAVGWTVSVLLVVAAIVLGFQLTRGLFENLLRSSPAGEEAPAAASRRAILRLVFLLLLLQIGYSFLTLPILFDRHLLLLLPTALVLLVAIQGTQAKFRRAVFAPCLLILAGYSIAGTHDLHAISRTAFRAGETLVAEGVDPQFIDGGFAFDGWYMFEQAQEELAAGHPPVRRVSPTVQDAWYIRNLMPRILTRYIVSLSPAMNTEDWEGALAPWTRSASLGPRFEAHDVRTTYSYRTYWPWRSATLYVLEDRELAAALDR